ncbi:MULTISPECIES: hypothetical protein [Bacillus]|uniref:hypothetical protein n=1 Tax=Bacillus amyloliquefaciens group TaxID=1938374 RepID=UPI0039E0E92B
MSNKQQDLKNKIKGRGNNPAATFFEQVGNVDDVNNNVNNNINDKDEVKVVDEIDEILNKKNEQKSVVIGIHFEPTVARALKKLSKQKKQSKFVNAAVKQVLIEKGLLDG